MRSLIPLIFLSGVTAGIGLGAADWATTTLGVIMGVPAMRLVWQETP